MASDWERYNVKRFVALPRLLRLRADLYCYSGKLMYSRDDMIQFVKLLEKGLLPHGANLVDVKTYGFEQWKEALEVAAEHMGIGRLVTLYHEHGTSRSAKDVV